MRFFTGVFLLTAVSLLIAWDIAAYLVAGPQATISMVVMQAAVDHPVVTFSLGALCGHILWPLRRKATSR